MKIQDIAYMSISLALVVVCSKISFQIGPVPITLQTLAVIFVGLFLKTKKAAIVFASYLIMGLAGLPVFSSGGGPAYVLVPSFGFILGFFLSVFITGSRVFNQYKISMFIKSVLGIVVIHLVGLIYMLFIMNGYKHLEVSFWYVLEVGSIPFLLKDFISSILAAVICIRLNKVIILEPIKEFSGKENEKCLK